MSRKQRVYAALIARNGQVPGQAEWRELGQAAGYSAKGILMERHGIDEASAFERIREQSRVGNRKLVDVAMAIIDGHSFLPRHPSASS